MGSKGETMTEIRLAEMLPGEMGRVCGFYSGDPAYRQQLLAMGLTPNTVFTVVRRAPLGDPVQIRVHNFALSLRQQEARLLKIERVVPTHA